MRYHEMESKFETLLMEWIWIKKHEIKLANTFCRSWEPTRARTNRIAFWMRREQQLQKWKIIDCIAVPISWVTRSTVARNCRAQNLTDHWPVMTYVRLPQKEGWRYQNNSILKGWRPKTESDESGFGRMIVGSLEDCEDLMGDISIEDITETLPRLPERLNLNQQEEDTNPQRRRGSKKNHARDAEGQEQTSCLSCTVFRKRRRSHK